MDLGWIRYSRTYSDGANIIIIIIIIIIVVVGGGGFLI